MKKSFDFSDDNFILDKLWDWLKKKVPNKVIAVMLASLLDVSYMGLFFSFFVMPFISYSSLALKIVFSVLWGMSCAVWIISLLDDWKKQSKDDKWSMAIGLFCFIVFFGLCFVNNNYYHLGQWWQIAIVCAMLLLSIAAIYKFIKDLIQNPKDTLASLLMGVLLVLGFLCILASSLDALEMDLRKKLLITGAFSVALPILALIIAYILGIFKPKKVMEYGSLVIFCILMLIGIAYIISFLNPETDGYATFVTLFASLLGGGLTLVGVAWTIKDGNDKRQKELERIESERKDEERKKYRPFVNVYVGNNVKGLKITSDIMATEWLQNTDKISNKPTADLVVANNIRGCWFGNTDFCSFYVWGIKIDGNMTNFNSIRYIKKEFYFPLNFTGPIYTEKPIKKLSLILEDMLGGLYELKLDCSLNSIYQQIVISGNEPTIFIGEKKMEKTDE